MSTNNITHLRIVEAGEDFRLQADQVLTEATGTGLRDVVVFGRSDDGSLYLAANRDDGAALLMLAQAQQMIVLGSMEAEE